MRRLLYPAIWLPIALLLLTHGGARLLRQPAAMQLSERDRTSYGYMPQWRTRFDALSAACGAGLLSYDLDEDYTAQGRWVLLGVGAAGALLYLTAARQALGRLWTGVKLPPIWAILVGYIAVQIVAIALALAVTAPLGTPTAPSDAAWNAVSAFSSLGWLREPPGVNHAGLYAGIALLGALGWPLWLLPWRRVLRWRAFLLCVGGYCAFLALAAGLFTALNAPRATPPGHWQTTAATVPQPEHPVWRGAVQIAAASGAGIATEDLPSGNVSEGAKFVLSGVLLVGGLGGSAGGGTKWTLVLWTLAGAGVIVGCGRGRSNDETARRALLAGGVTLCTLSALTIIVTVGLLLIERHVGSPYQAPPTLADVLLDASSAVSGGNLSSGLTAMLTSENLSRGIRQSVDLYQYGMTWLMAAMFMGRILPVLVLARVAGCRFSDTPASPPPLV